MRRHRDAVVTLWTLHQHARQAGASLPADTQVRFTLYWPDDSRWQGEDDEVVVEG